MIAAEIRASAADGHAVDDRSGEGGIRDRAEDRDDGNLLTDGRADRRDERDRIARREGVVPAAFERDVLVDRDRAEVGPGNNANRVRIVCRSDDL